MNANIIQAQIVYTIQYNLTDHLRLYMITFFIKN